MQNIQNAVTHAESRKSLAWCTIEQVPSVRKHRSVAHRLPIVRLLPRETGVNTRRQVAVAVALPGAP